MIENINTLTIKKYSLFDKTNKLRYLKCWWNILPTFLFKKKLFELASSIHKRLSGIKLDSDFEKEVHRINSINKIQLLIALYQAAYNLLENLASVNVWKRSMGLEETKPENLKEYTDKILKYTGYKIKTVKDLVLVKNEIDRLSEKFAEFFPKEKITNKKGATFMQIYLGVISVMDIPFSYDMIMSDFLEAKDDAYERIKKMKSNG